jgi:hypothetical protein
MLASPMGLSILKDKPVYSAESSSHVNDVGARKHRNAGASGAALASRREFQMREVKVYTLQQTMDAAPIKA